MKKIKTIRKNEKAITLISLTVTIIVLIIISSIGVGMLTLDDRYSK